MFINGPLPYYKALAHFLISSLLLILLGVLFFKILPTAAALLTKPIEVVDSSSYGNPQDVPNWVTRSFHLYVIGGGIVLAMLKQSHRIFYGAVEVLFVWQASKQWILTTASSTNSINWIVFIGLLYVASRGFDNMMEGLKTLRKSRDEKESHILNPLMIEKPRESTTQILAKQSNKKTKHLKAKHDQSNRISH